MKLSENAVSYIICQGVFVAEVKTLYTICRKKCAEITKIIRVYVLP